MLLALEPLEGPALEGPLDADPPLDLDLDLAAFLAEADLVPTEGVVSMQMGSAGLRPVPACKVPVKCRTAAYSSANGLADSHQGWVPLMQLKGMHAVQHAVWARQACALCLHAEVPCERWLSACASANGLADKYQGQVLLMQLKGMHAAQQASTDGAEGGSVSTSGAKGSLGQHSPPRHHQAKLVGCRLAWALIWGKRTWGDDRLLFLLHALPLFGLHRRALGLRCCGVSRVHVLVFRLRLQHQHCTPLPSASGHTSAQAVHTDPAGLASLTQVLIQG